MKRFLKVICTTIVFSLLFPSVLTLSSFDDYSDATGHWAENSLRLAYNDGLIDGIDGKLLPDESITTAQTLAILCRALGATTPADISGSGISTGKWYYDYAAKSVYLGLISNIDETTLEATMSRQDAFCALAEAFQLIEADPDMAVLEQFADYDLIKDENRQAIASLVTQGLIGGSDGKLDVNGSMSRAAFVAVIYRVIRRFIPSDSITGSYNYGVVVQGSAALSGEHFGKTVWFDCTVSDIDLDGVDADNIIIRSNALDSLRLGGSTHIGRLTLAAQSGDIAVVPEEDAVVETLVIGSGRGMISTKGVDAIEVIGNNRYVTIMDSVESIVVSGRNNTINVQAGAEVGSIELLMSANGSRVIADGKIEELNIMSIKSAVSGSGNVETLKLFRTDTTINIMLIDLIDKVDIGLTDATIALKVPENLPIGDTLVATATIENAASGTVCGLTWYIDDVPVLEKTITIGTAIPKLTHEFEYSHDMPESIAVRAAVSYTSLLGEPQELSAESVVMLENYGKQYWMDLAAPQVLEKVTVGYLGDFTLEWALENDLDDYEKEVWVNAKGYTSASDYLLWINLAYQRVNIFQRVDDSWELIRTCLAGTGAPGRGTPPGVWTTSFKQVDGWTTSSYTVKPVTRFMGSVGYAFHSRLYYPGTTEVRDPSIGFPISSGCVRMYDEDAWFIYDNIPNGTTVVVH